MMEQFDIKPVETDVLKAIFPDYNGLESYKECISRMVAQCLQDNIHKVLADLTRVSVRIPVFDLYELGRHFTMIPGCQTIKYAFVVRAEIMYEDNFFENLMVNRGLEIKRFTDFDEALRWFRNG
jgi:hypothetical protein